MGEKLKTEIPPFMYEKQLRQTDKLIYCQEADKEG